MINSNQWNSIRKKTDRAKKMLTVLHMSSAYLKVSWGSMDEGEQAKISKWIVKNGSGWFETAKPTPTPKGIKKIAPKHHKAAVKKKSVGILRKPMELKPKTKKELLQAIVDGKQIPDRVLNEYSELIPKKAEGESENFYDQKPDESTLEQVKNAGIIMEDLYIDDSEGIRLRILNGELKGKTAHRCPECDRGLNWSNTKSVFACGEHGSIPVEKAFDMRRIGMTKDADKWANRVYGNFLEDARTDGFKTVEEYYNSLSDTESDGIKKWILLGVGLEKLLPRSELLAQQKSIDEQFFKAVYRRIDEGYNEFAKTGNIVDFDVAWATEFKKYYEAVPESDRRELTLKLDGLRDYVREKIQEKEKIKESPTVKYLEKELQHRKDNLDPSPIPLKDPSDEEINEAIAFAKLYSSKIQFQLSVFDIVIQYYFSDIDHTPNRLDLRVMAKDGELNYSNSEYDMNIDVAKIHRIHDGEVRLLQESERIKEENERETKKVNEKDRTEKKPTKYFKITIKNGKTVKTPLKNANPFEYQGIQFITHKEGTGWHATEQTTGLVFESGTTEADAIARTKSKVDATTPQNVIEMTQQARSTLAIQGIL